MLVDRILCASDHLDPGFHLGLGGAHQLLDFPRCVAGTLCKRAHFLGHDSKAASALAGPGRLDTGVERQKIGLEGNFVDDTDDLADLLGRSFDIGHGRDRLAGHLAAAFNRLPCRRSRFFRRPRLGSIAADAVDNRAQGQNRFAKGFGLNLRGCRQALRACAEPCTGCFERCRALADRDQVALQAVERAVEPAGNAVVAFGNIRRRADGEIAFRQPLDDSIENRIGFGLSGLALLDQLALMGMALFVEAQRDGDLGIDEDRSDQCGDEFQQFTLARLAKRQHGLRPEILDHRAEQPLQHNGVTGNLPARIEPHLAFGIRQNLDALRIEAVEARIGQHVPVRGLQIVQTFDLAIAGEVAGGFGKGLEALEEIAQRQLDLRAERLAMPANDVGLAIIKTSKAQTLKQTACLGLSRLIC